MTLIFCKTKATVDKLAKFLTDKNVETAAIHGDMQQSKRNKVMTALRKGSLQTLIASDLAARGIDVDGVTHVINYDVPEDPEIYVHRIGRTARAGRNGEALMFVTPEQGHMLTNIEALTNVEIVEKQYPEFKPSPEPKKIRAQKKAEEERIEEARKAKSRSKLDVPSTKEGNDKESFPGGVVPTGLPNKRMGGRIRPRKR